MNVERSFDPAARLSTQTGPSGTFAWSYTPWNGLPAAVTNAASGVHVAYAWDILDRPTNIVWRKADGDIQQLHIIHSSHRKASLNAYRPR